MNHPVAGGGAVIRGDACVGVATVSAPATSERRRTGLATPEDEPGCPGLVHVAAGTLQFLPAATPPA
jgi:hypothetical protein